MVNNNLVGGIPTPLKNIGQLGWLFPIDGKNMFQTTNQVYKSNNRHMITMSALKLES